MTTPGPGAECAGIDPGVGPVRATPTHPGATTLGWAGFERAAQGAAIPVFALGGVDGRDLERAWQAGAHGVAMIRGAWAPRDDAGGEAEA